MRKLSKKMEKKRDASRVNVKLKERYNRKVKTALDLTYGILNDYLDERKKKSGESEILDFKFYVETYKIILKDLIKKK